MRALRRRLRLARASEQARDRKLLAKQCEDDQKRDRVREGESDPKIELALRDQALNDVETIAVKHVEQRRGDEIRRAAHARIHIGQWNRDQRQHQRRYRHRDAPEELGAFDPLVDERQHARGHGFCRHRQRAQLRRLDPAAELFELDHAIFGCSGLAFVTTAVFQNDEAIAVGGLLQMPARSDGRGVDVGLNRVQEDVANRTVERIDRFDESHQVGTRKLAKKSRCDQNELIARFELPFVFQPALLGPRGQIGRQQHDRDQERGRKKQDKTQTSGQRLAGGKPDDHLAVPIPARQRQQDGQEQRDRQQNVEIKQRREAQQRQDTFGRYRTAGGSGQYSQYQVGEQDREQDQKQPDR